MPKSAGKVLTPVKFPNDYWVFAADLSFTRPGFCKLNVHKDENGTIIRDVAFTSVNNKNHLKFNKPDGAVLDEIFWAMGTFCPHNDNDPSLMEPIYFVREAAFNSRGSKPEIQIFKVVGVADLWAYVKKKRTWFEISPMTVKKAITGNGRADKQQVADYLKLYLGDLPYGNDDESDATAVAISFLLQYGEIENKLEIKNTKQGT